LLTHQPPLKDFHQRTREMREKEMGERRSMRVRFGWAEEKKIESEIEEKRKEHFVCFNRKPRAKIVFCIFQCLII